MHNVHQRRQFRPVAEWQKTHTQGKDASKRKQMASLVGSSATGVSVMVDFFTFTALRMVAV